MDIKYDVEILTEWGWVSLHAGITYATRQLAEREVAFQSSPDAARNSHEARNIPRASLRVVPCTPAGQEDAARVAEALLMS